MNEENGLPEGWMWTTIGEVAETTSGGTPSRNHPEYYGGAIPWVKSGELRDTAVYDVEEFITEEGLKNSNAKVFQQGTVLVAMYGATVGKTGILGLDATTNQAVCAIFPLMNAFTSKFIAYWLQSQRQTLVDLSFGGAQPNINQGIIRAFPLPLPPLPEQQRIVAAIEQQFSRLDAGVAALRRAQAKLKRYRAAVLKAAVEGKLTESWRAEYPSTETASQLLERILAERRAKWEADLRAKGKDPAKVRYVEPAKPDVGSLPGLPEGWCWGTIDQVADTIGGVTKGRNLVRRVTTTLPYLRVANVQRIYVDLSVIKTIEVPLDEVDRYLLHYGDVLLTEGGDADKLGRAALWQGQISQCIHQNHIFRARLIDKSMSSLWLIFYANSEQGRAYFLNAAKQAVNLASINLTQLRNCPLPLPPLTEQEQIVAEVERRLSVVSQLESTVEANLKRAERLRQSILKKAFAGRLVPQDPDDEPASVLLERIRGEREKWKHGALDKGREVICEIPKPKKIDVKRTKQVELWESVESGE